MTDWEAERRNATKVAQELGFSARDAQLLAQLSRPAARLVADTAGRPERGASKLGGLPDVPAQFRWPVGDSGPMTFLAQIDARATSCVDGIEGWRATDSLVLFFADGDVVEGSVEAGAVLAVPLDPSGRGKPPPADVHSTLEERALRIEPVMTPPMEFRLEDAGELEYDPDADDWARLARLHERLGNGPAEITAGHHQLLGNPWVVGSLDPVWLGAVKLATEGEDPDAYDSPFRLLAQFTTDQDANLEIADAGAIYFVARADDIAAGTYDDVAVILESC